jgi:hypothetical protein
VANSSSLFFTSGLLLNAYLKPERLQWGSPTATAPFEPFLIMLALNL